jgi:hypothetical protein
MGGRIVSGLGHLHLKIDAENLVLCIEHFFICFLWVRTAVCNLVMQRLGAILKLLSNEMPFIEKKYHEKMLVTYWWHVLQYI